ncbi:MAG: [acyl-carrier-protein] S-malonyltransferase [Bacillota bacterium]|nr:[acyl-carrier-protein] S-malonyltransferase [Bacillota bacterium]
MAKIGLLFPGQGAQYVGMGQDLARRYPKARALFAEADAALGFPLSELCFTGPEEELTLTANTQPAILATSIACWEILKDYGVEPAVTAGLSLGEYSAHVSAGTLDFAEAVRLVRKRGEFMESAVPSGQGTMAAVLGLSREEVEEVCRAAAGTGVVEPANYNCPGQIVIAGETAAVTAAAELALARGAKKVIPLKVSGPFHSRLLAPAGERLAGELARVSLSDPDLPVVANVTAQYVRDKEEVKDLLVKQVSHPVLWEDSVQRMLADGVDTFIEVGPGRALSGFVKKIDRRARCLQVGDLSSLQNTLAELEGVG